MSVSKTLNISFQLLANNQVCIRFNNPTDQGASLKIKHSAGRYLRILQFLVQGAQLSSQVKTSGRRSFRFALELSARSNATVTYWLIGERPHHTLSVVINRWHRRRLRAQLIL